MTSLFILCMLLPFISLRSQVFKKKLQLHAYHSHNMCAPVHLTWSARYRRTVTRFLASASQNVCMSINLCLLYVPITEDTVIIIEIT